MINVKSKNIEFFQKNLLGNKVRFKSDCEFFPKFDVAGKVIRIYYKNTEIIFEIICNNKRQIKIGSNMKNLKYELI